MSYFYLINGKFLYILESSISKIWKTPTINTILKEVSVSNEAKIIDLPLFKEIKKNYYTEFWDEIDLYYETIRWKNGFLS